MALNALDLPAFYGPHIFCTSRLPQRCEYTYCSGLDGVSGANQPLRIYESRCHITLYEFLSNTDTSFSNKNAHSDLEVRASSAMCFGLQKHANEPFAYVVTEFTDPCCAQFTVVGSPTICLLRAPQVDCSTEHVL